MLKSKRKVFLPMQLQYFSGDGGDGGDGRANPEDEVKDDDKPGQGFSEEDFNKKLQTELDKIKAQHEQELEQARTEAEKLAKMTADEKAKFQMEQREKELADKEQSIAMRELKAETLKVLSEKDIPHDVMDIVIADNAENTAKNIETFKKVFDKAVQDTVEKRLAGKSPRVGGSNQDTNLEEVRNQFSNALKGMR